MKAIRYDRFGPPDVLYLTDEPQPKIKEKDVLVKVHSVAITTGDTEIRRPEIPYFIWLLVRLYFGIFKPRINILGAYFSGTIVEVGSKVSQFKKGDEVCGVTGPQFGAYAEYLRVSESEVFNIKPDNISHQEACPIALGLDSSHFISKSNLQPGEHILINGAGGGIGTYALQLAKHIGATVTVVDSGGKLKMLEQCGADYTIDYMQNETWKSKTKVDVIFDVVGTISVSDARTILNPKGRYVSAIPLASRFIPHSFWSIFSGQSFSSGLSSSGRAELNQLIGLLEKGILKTVLDRTYSLEEIPEGHIYIESGEKVGNIVATINQE